MKNIIRTLSVLILTAGLVNTAVAQIGTITSSDNREPAVASNHSIFPAAFSPASTAAAVFNVRAENNFAKTFSRSLNADWEKCPDGGFVASFAANDKKVMIGYNSKGRWVQTIYNYSADKLPENIKENMLDAYGDFRITLVNELHINDAVIYLVHLENTATARIARVTEDGMDEIEPLYKQ